MPRPPTPPHGLPTPGPRHAAPETVVTTGYPVVSAAPPDRLSHLPRVRNYEVLSVIGAGGMGVVFKARHTELRRVVALKLLHGSHLHDPEFRARFRGEAEAIARLQHPNIIQVFEVGTVEPRTGEVHPSPYLALEFVDGGSLAQRTHTPQSPAFVAGVVEKLARAAHAAHQVGVVHRDLKPANVILTRGGEPKVADFGLAKQFRDARDRAITQDGTVVGTPEHMAPEQLAGAPPTPAIDVYALGVILYELLTARVPFQGTNVAETMHQVLYLDPVPPRQLLPGVPLDLETICLKCLEKSPHRRYETAEALADDLARYAGGHTIRARSVGAGGRAVRWARRNPALAVLSAALVVATLGGVAGVFWKWQEAEANADAARAAVGEADARTRAERRERYRANIAAAASAHRLNNVAAARRLLMSAPDEHRDWEWRYFHAHLDEARHTLADGDSPAADMWVSPDGRWAVTYSADRAVRVWDVAAPALVRTIPNAPEVFPLRVSPDGRTFAYPLPDFGVALRDRDADRPRLVLRGCTKDVLGLAFSPDGSRVLAGCADRTGRAWDARTGEPLGVYRGHTTAAAGAAVTPDGRTAVTTDHEGRTVHLWDVATGRGRAVLGGHAAVIVATRLDADGRRLLVAEGYPSNVVRVWDVATSRELAALRGHENQTTAWDFSPDGRLVVTASFDQTVRVWDAATGAVRHVLHGHAGRVGLARFSPDGRRVASAGEDRTVRVWDAETGDPVAVLHGCTANVFKLTYSADGATVVTLSDDGSVRVWDARAAEAAAPLRGHANFVYAVAFHPDGVRAASASWDGTARVWDTTTGQSVREFAHDRGAILSAVAFSPDGRTLATLARDAAHFWDVATGRRLARWPLPAAAWRDSRLAYRPQGDLVAAGTTDGTVHLWSVADGREVAVLRGHADGVRDVAFSPDGRWLASASDDRTVRVWDVATRAEARVLAGHTSGAYCVAFRPDGGLLASGSPDGTVRLWDATAWQPAGVLKHGTNVYGLAFTPDGGRLASACADTTIRVWDAARQEEIVELRGHGKYVHALAFSPDGARLVSGSGDFTVRVWDAGRP